MHTTTTIATNQPSSNLGQPLGEAHGSRRGSCIAALPEIEAGAATSGQQHQSKEALPAANKREEKQQSEKTMHQVLMHHTDHVLHDGRKDLYDNPKGIKIWAKSMLQGLEYVNGVKAYDTDTCPFSELPDGQRHRNPTRFKISVI